MRLKKVKYKRNSKLFRILCARKNILKTFFQFTIMCQFALIYSINTPMNSTEELCKNVGKVWMIWKHICIAVRTEGIGRRQGVSQHDAMCQLHWMSGIWEQCQQEGVEEFQESDQTHPRGGTCDPTQAHRQRSRWGGMLCVFFTCHLDSRMFLLLRLWRQRCWRL